MRSMVPARTASTEVATRPSRLSKAAIILMALDEERSHRVIGRLDHDEIRRLSNAMANLGRASVETVEQAFDEFRSEVGRTCNIIGNAETTEKMLLRVLPSDKVAEIMDEIQGPNGKNIWEKLAHIPPQMLAGYLRNEYPQTAGVILAKLPPQHSARVLRLLPERLVADISVRLVRMNSVQRTVLSDIEETLKREFSTELSRSYGRDSTSIIAEMLNRSEKEVMDRVMASLDEHEPEAAARVRRIMFTFEDLRRIDVATFGLFIAECPAEKLPLALMGATREMQELFLAHMSERAGNLLREEMEIMPMPRRKLVDEAQSEIVTLAKRLSDEGRIVILEDEEDEEGFLN